LPRRRKKDLTRIREPAKNAKNLSLKRMAQHQCTLATLRVAKNQISTIANGNAWHNTISRSSRIRAFA
jgi:hypothetical protein